MAEVPRSQKKVVHFYSEKKEKYPEEEQYRRCFSNFSEHRVKYKGVIYPSAEHAFQTAKMVRQEDKDLVFNAPTPMQAATIARDRSRPIQENWDELSPKVMKEILMCKFTQNKECNEALMKTGDAYLEERTKNDARWGSGSDSPNGPGKNLLGKLLVEVREEIKAELCEF